MTEHTDANRGTSRLLMTIGWIILGIGMLIAIVLRCTDQYGFITGFMLMFVFPVLALAATATATQVRCMGTGSDSPQRPSKSPYSLQRRVVSTYSHCMAASLWCAQRLAMALVGSCTVTSIAPACADQAHEFSNRNASCSMRGTASSPVHRSRYSAYSSGLRCSPCFGSPQRISWLAASLVVPKRSYSA